MISRSWWFTGLAGLLVAFLIPLVAHWIRGERGLHCAWDGLEIEPLYQVDIVDQSGSAHTFCCLRCAEFWLHRRDRLPERILVVDEASGQEIDSADAHYVRSTVVINRITGERRHVFLHADDALNHVAAARGHQLLGDERPFAKITDAITSRRRLPEK